MIICTYTTSCEVVEIIHGNIDSDKLSILLLEHTLSFNIKMKEKIFQKCLEMQQQSLPSNEIHCTACRSPDGTKKIACDGANCRAIFHLRCVGLIKRPSGNWYCFDCRTEMVLGVSTNASSKPCVLSFCTYSRQKTKILLTKLMLDILPEGFETSHLCGIAACVEGAHMVAELHCLNILRILCHKCGYCVNNCSPPCIFPPAVIGQEKL